MRERNYVTNHHAVTSHIGYVIVVHSAIHTKAEVLPKDSSAVCLIDDVQCDGIDGSKKATALRQFASLLVHQETQSSKEELLQ